MRTYRAKIEVTGALNRLPEVIIGATFDIKHTGTVVALDQDEICKLFEALFERTYNVNRYSVKAVIIDEERGTYDTRPN